MLDLAKPKAECTTLETSVVEPVPVVDSSFDPVKELKKVVDLAPKNTQWKTRKNTLVSSEVLSSSLVSSEVLSSSLVSSEVFPGFLS